MMSWVVMLTIVLAGVLFLLILAVALKDSGRENADSSETRILQEIYQDLQRMEDRLAALETILLERERK